MKKSLIISVIISLLLVLFTGCSDDTAKEKNTSLSADFSSIMQALSENYDVKAVNGYSTDAIPNTDGYEFKVDGKSFKVLKMEESDFNSLDLDNKDGDFLKNNDIVKNNSKPYIAFIEKGGNTEVLEDFKNIEIE